MSNPNLTDIGEWDNNVSSLKVIFTLPASDFDPAWYLDNNPDVTAAGYTVEDAQEHWKHYGLAEGRQSSANFSIAGYVARYPELQQAFGSNLVPA